MQQFVSRRSLPPKSPPSKQQAAIYTGIYIYIFIYRSRKKKVFLRARLVYIARQVHSHQLLLYIMLQPDSKICAYTIYQRRTTFKRGPTFTLGMSWLLLLLLSHDSRPECLVVVPIYSIVERKPAFGWI